MKIFPSIVLLFSMMALRTSAQVIHIPTDYPTIQEGINAAAQGDTVLVAPGTYFENIVLNGINITLGSYFLTTNDISYISSTIIDGNQAGSVITVNQGEGSTSRISGFSITNGKSSQGGGIYCYSYSHTELNNTIVSGNYALYYGGGISSESNATIYLHSSTISNNIAGYAGGGIYWYGTINTHFDSIKRNNIYLNRAGTGNDLFSYNEPVFVVLDTFTVMIPTKFHAEHLELFNFDIRAGKLDQVDQDLYVSPAGDNDNSGLTAESPLRTIGRAFQKIRPDLDHYPTVHVANGVYSPSGNGEIFPVPIINRTSLAGESRDSTILDAEGTSNVISLYYDTVEIISNLTITGGTDPYYGGGIQLIYSPVHLDNIRLTGNSAIGDFIEGTGGGIEIMYTGQTALSNMIIDNNTSTLGGGMASRNSNIDLINVEFINNVASTGGGIYLEYRDTVRFDQVSFKNNKATELGGGIYANNTKQSIISNSFICSNSAKRGAGICTDYSSFVVKNTLIADNAASQYGGGAVLYVENYFSPQNNNAFVNVTFSGNTFPSLYSFGSGLRLVNSILWGNDNPYQLHFDDGGADDTLSILNTDIEGGLAGIYMVNPPSVSLLSSNIHEDPQFLLNGDNPYSLASGSPCIDAGTADTTGLNLTEQDLLGNQRIWDGNGDGVSIIDLGPYEYKSPGAIPEDGKQKSPGLLDFSIFPNPAKVYLTIQTTNNNSDRSVTFYDCVGKPALSAIILAGHDKLIINIDQLSQGIYTIILNDEDGSFAVKKVVVMKE